MFRQPLLPCASLIVGLGLAIVALPVPAFSQDGSTPERLDRLERDLNMLQRQVYRGGAPTMAGGGAGAVNTELRMDRLETQMRELTGRVEEMVNEVQQVKHRVEQVNSDVEQRFTQGSAGGPAVASAAPPSRQGSARSLPPFPAAPSIGADADLTPPRGRPGPGPAALLPPGTAVPPPDGPEGGGLTPIFGTLTPPGAGPPPGMASAAPPARSAAAPSTAAATTPAAQYNQAFGLVKQANYPAAEAALKAFVEQHPKDPMAGNAQYWLGETYYSRGKYMEAASAFAEGYKRYPKSAKAPDALLKLGMALGHANQKQNACVAFAQLDRDFPHAGAPIKQRAETEKKKLGC